MRPGYVRTIIIPQMIAAITLTGARRLIIISKVFPSRIQKSQRGKDILPPGSRQMRPGENPGNIAPAAVSAARDSRIPRIGPAAAL